MKKLPENRNVSEAGDLVQQFRNSVIYQSGNGKRLAVS